jgi:glyoxylase-like metal-dependent hydrolase (beta-lactamase superfamily II)
MLHELAHNRGDYHTIESYQAMEGGERIAVKSGLLEVVHTPGHAPGHLCLFSPEEHYLISGDHLLKAITPNIAWRPEEDMLARYLESLEVVKPLENRFKGTGGWWTILGCTTKNAVNRSFPFWRRSRLRRMTWWGGCGRESSHRCIITSALWRCCRIWSICAGAGR